MRPALREEGGRVGRFLIVGGLSVVTYYSLLWGLTEFAGVWYIVSAVVAFVGYYFVNFLSQKYWTFKNNDRDALNRQLIQYTLMAIANWLIGSGGFCLSRGEGGVEYKHEDSLFFGGGVGGGIRKD